MKVDNIKLQELGCFFFTVLFAFLEEWKGFTYQSQAEVDQLRSKDHFADLARGCLGQSTRLQKSNPRNFREFFLDFGVKRMTEWS